MSKQKTSKFKLIPSPTFSSKVEMPIHGSDEVSEMTIIFKHMPRKKLEEFQTEIEGMEIADVILQIAEGWDLDEEWNKENVTLLSENYIGAATAIISKYFEELVQARIKN